MMDDNEQLALARRAVTALETIASALGKLTETAKVTTDAPKEDGTVDTMRPVSMRTG